MVPVAAARRHATMQQSDAVPIPRAPTMDLDTTACTDASSSPGDDHSFIVLERMTADDSEKIERELASSVHAFSLGGTVSEGAGAAGGAMVSNHFGEMQTPTGPSPGAPFSLRDIEVPVHISNGVNSLPIDVQQKMDSLIQENLHLQITVDQTNKALRQTMMTLEQWRGDMEKVRQDHKERFQETRALVLQLKKEKADMRVVIEELQAKIGVLETKRMPSLFENVVPTVNEMELKSTVDSLQSELSIALAARDAEVQKNGLYLTEISSLKDKINALQTHLQDLYAAKEEAQKSTETLHSANMNELMALREENLRLKSDVVNLCSVERHSQDYQIAQAKGFTHRIDELTAKLLLKEEELQKAQTEIDELREKESSPNPNEETLARFKTTVERLRLRIDDMTATIVRLEEKCDNQEQENAELREAKLKQEEAVGILQAQVEVYRVDFIAERDCRQRLAGEKEQLAADLRRLHHQNLELLNKQPAQSHIPVPEGQHRDSNERNPDNVEEEDQTGFIYRCPICSIMTFRSLQAVNEHIDRCLGGFTEIP